MGPEEIAVAAANVQRRANRIDERGLCVIDFDAEALPQCLDHFVFHVEVHRLTRTALAEQLISDSLVPAEIPTPRAHAVVPSRRLVREATYDGGVTYRAARQKPLILAHTARGVCWERRL